MQDEMEKFIIDNLENHPNDIIAFTAGRFKASRPAIQKHVNKLISDRVIERGSGKGRTPGYSLVTDEHFNMVRLDDESNRDENILFKKYIQPYISDCPRTVQEKMDYIGGEILNNAISHSDGKTLRIVVRKNAKELSVMFIDDGVGIFRKIQNGLGLFDPKEAILELCKGKYSSDPDNHSGEGIFFSSRMSDKFIISSYGVGFVSEGDYDTIEDIDGKIENVEGTGVWAFLRIDSTRTAASVLDEYSTPDFLEGFVKTSIPLRAMLLEGGTLVSRSQGKRLMTRGERFRNVVLDFSGVEYIGQGFADEVFRVWRSKHPDVNVSYVNANDLVRKMILHVEAGIKQSET